MLTIPLVYVAEIRQCEFIFTFLHLSLSVLVYLALYRLDELGIAHFRKFIVSHEANKMFKVSVINICSDFFLNTVYTVPLNQAIMTMCNCPLTPLFAMASLNC